MSNSTLTFTLNEMTDGSGFQVLPLSSLVQFELVDEKEMFPYQEQSCSEDIAANNTKTGNFEFRRKPLAFERLALDNIAKYEKESRERIISQIANEITIIIQQDEFLDGEVSRSELYIKNAYAKFQLDYVADALMQLYLANLHDAHFLEGILIMISSVPYEAIEPKGQTMAMGLLTNKELPIRDRAIQCFEKWNSKKGLSILNNLDCHPKWLQKYAEKVIMYIERDGID